MKKFEICVNGKVFEVEVNEICGSDMPSPRASATIVTSPQEVQKAACTPKFVETEAISAPMPGKVMSIKAYVGQVVKSGDIIITLEAMKMENEIFSGLTGTVREIRVCEGSVVNAGDILVIIG